MRDAMDGKTAALEAELGQIQAQLRIAEQDGAEIAALAEQTITELRLEIARLKTEMRDSGAFCHSCQRKRKIIALFVGVVFLAVWFRINPPEPDSDLTWLGIWSSLIPIFSVVIKWRLLLLRRRFGWKPWNDNWISHRISAWLTDVGSGEGRR
jgi:hypothetical protein